MFGWGIQQSKPNGFFLKRLSVCNKIYVFPFFKKKVNAIAKHEIFLKKKKMKLMDG